MFSGPEIPMTVFRLAGRAGPGDPEVEQLRAELSDVRRQLSEVQERLDFAERVLARERDAERLAPPR
ncbi:MAG TPA: hypothetical protein VFU41_06425 [Gemmatimonadales bacterium]|nr:hypothetical protein [Gemmatimonadales bacterium]